VDLELKLIRNTLVVRIAGDMDMLVAEELRTQIDSRLDNNQVNNLIVNLEKVTFIDSSGLGVIIGRYKKVSAAGGKMYIAGVKPAIEKILFLSGINRLIPIFKNEQDVLSI
jgi:stage II sporulation protein AA (anti-sigma F factor antagonist)